MIHKMMVWACIASIFSLAPEVGLLEVAVAAEKKADIKCPKCGKDNDWDIKACWYCKTRLDVSASDSSGGAVVPEFDLNQYVAENRGKQLFCPKCQGRRRYWDAKCVDCGARFLIDNVAKTLSKMRKKEQLMRAETLESQTITVAEVGDDEGVDVDYAPTYDGGVVYHVYEKGKKEVIKHGKVYYWHPSRPLAEVAGSEATVEAMCVSPTGQLVVYRSQLRGLFLKDLRDPARPARTLTKTPTEQESELMISRDGRRLFYGRTQTVGGYKGFGKSEWRSAVRYSMLDLESGVESLLDMTGVDLPELPGHNEFEAASLRLNSVSPRGDAVIFTTWLRAEMAGGISIVNAPQENYLLDLQKNGTWRLVDPAQPGMAFLDDDTVASTGRAWSQYVRATPGNGWLLRLPESWRNQEGGKPLISLSEMRQLEWLSYEDEASKAGQYQVSLDGKWVAFRRSAGFGIGIGKWPKESGHVLFGARGGDSAQPLTTSKRPRWDMKISPDNSSVYWIEERDGRKIRCCSVYDLVRGGVK